MHLLPERLRLHRRQNLLGVLEDDARLLVLPKQLLLPFLLARLHPHLPLDLPPLLLPDRQLQKLPIVLVLLRMFPRLPGVPRGEVRAIKQQHSARSHHCYWSGYPAGDSGAGLASQAAEAEERREGISI